MTPLEVLRSIDGISETVLRFLTDNALFLVRHWATSSDDPNQDARVETANSASANVVSSVLKGTELHRPVLDIDIPAALIPSSTPGHSHLYIDRLLSWPQYEKLLAALADAGIIERGYYDTAVKRKATFVRLPWIKK